LKDSEAIKNVFVTFGRYPLLGVLLGIAITMLFQSSSATIALLQIMAFSGLIDFYTCIPIILGDNIGTTITAQLAAIGTNNASRRTARAHALLNIIGVCYMLIPVYMGIYGRLIERIVPGPITKNNIMLHIALSHSAFNIINSFFIFLPLINILEKLTVKLTPPKKGEIDMTPMYLEKHLLETPTLALEQSVNEIVRMIQIAHDALNNAIESFLHNDPNLFGKINEQEDAVDNLQKEITQYLVQLSQKRLEESEAETIPVLLHSVNDVERVSDHAINILELANRKIDQNLPFSEEALSGIDKIVGVVSSMFENTTAALKKKDSAPALKVLEEEEELNKLQIELKADHIRRVHEGKCDLISGIVFNDFVDNNEKIGDHLTNIAQGVLRHLRWDMEMNRENQKIPAS
jgi:phosphate:Na+ symporter